MDFVSPRLVHVSVCARGGPLVRGSRNSFGPHPICLRGRPLSVGPALAPCPEGPVCGTSFLLLFSLCLRGGPLSGGPTQASAFISRIFYRDFWPWYAAWLWDAAKAVVCGGAVGCSQAVGCGYFVCLCRLFCVLSKFLLHWRASSADTLPLV